MKFLAGIYRYFLSLRYKVELKGCDVLKSDSAKFILPNHQAMVDPQILFTQIYRYTTVVPIVTDVYFKNFILRKIFRMLEAVPVSDLSAGSRDTKVLQTIYQNVIQALHNNKNVLLYPSGQLTGQGYEKIFNKQSAWAVVKDLPENAVVIGVRIHGLWGSIWSKAWYGKSPGFFRTFLKSIFFVLANFIFFLPKRKVVIEFTDITDKAKEYAETGRNDFNNFLEEFYNIHGEEKVSFIKHYFYASKLKRSIPEKIIGSFNEVKCPENSVKTNIPEDVFNTVASIIVNETKLKICEIKSDSNINLDLAIDSIVLVNIIASIENSFDVVSHFEVTDIKTVEDLCRIAMGFGIGNEILKVSTIHKHQAPFSRIVIDNSQTITALFIKKFYQYKNEPFAYDKIMGSTTRKEFLLKAMVVSKLIRKQCKGKYVGIMLPAMQSTTLLVISTYLAGKIPVMLNWTVGKKVLEHCVECVDLDTILTAKSFFDKVENILPESLKNKCVFFEEKVKGMNFLTKISGLLNYYFKYTPATKPDDTAVILFTSGSETLPKAVPLTHRNIVNDLWGVFNVINLNTDIIFLAFLPPFHSFGFTVLTALPLITALKTAYTPDPTDNRELLKILKHTRCNTILGTPTFLKLLLAISSKNDLKNIRLAISGAESMPSSLIKTFQEKTNDHALLLEGYGITECSPVLTINPQNKQKEKSVGVFIKGVQHLIVDINTYNPLECNEQGMIMVKGNCIFNGYMDKEIESPFVKINGEDYYKTGDLGYVDEEGYLFITGRLKRFIKIAGEMISLPAIENILLKQYGSDEEVLIAVEGNDSIEPPQIVLFSKIKTSREHLSIDLSEVNKYLKNNGFSNLVKINKIIEVDEIPLLGTGKTDYKVLKGMI